MNPTLKSAFTIVGIGALMGAAVLFIVELWFESQDPIAVKAFETGLAGLGLVVGCKLIEREVNGG